MNNNDDREVIEWARSCRNTQTCAGMFIFMFLITYLILTEIFGITNMQIQNFIIDVFHKLGFVLCLA